MAPKAKKEVPAPPKAEAQGKALNARKRCWKVSTATYTQKKIARHPPSGGPRHCDSRGSTNILRRAFPGETSLITMLSSSFCWPLSLPRRRQTTTTHLCSLWMLKPTSTRSNRLWRSSMTLMWPRSTPCQPDGEKKAYVQLPPDYDALDVANKIGII